MRVQLPSRLAVCAGGARDLELEADTVSGLISDLARSRPGLGPCLGPADEASAFPVRWFVNGIDIRYLRGFDTPLADGDEVVMIPERLMEPGEPA